MAYYFISDLHLGAVGSKTRELRVVEWLDEVEDDCEALYLVGDVFDYWYEYRSVVPRGAVRLLGKLALMADQGVKIHFFKGNHDMWMFDYMRSEVGATVHSDELVIDAYGKKIFMHHGDGLGPGDKGYKLIKKVFRNSICQWLFAVIHPNVGLWLMKTLSQLSRNSKHESVDDFQGGDEWLASYVLANHSTIQADYYLFGHRHIPWWITNEESGYTCVNLGDWITNRSFAKLDNSGLSYGHFQQENPVLKKFQI